MTNLFVVPNLLFLFFFFSIFSNAINIVDIPRLPIEAHGFNDINVWPQLLVKGVRWLKIDIAVCTKLSCTSFSTWNKIPGRGDESDCFTDSGTEYCCLCLRGDTSSRPNLLDPFNTTYDFVAFFDEEENQRFLPKITEIDDQLSIGLDFGSGPIFPGPGGCFFGCAAAPLIRKFVISLDTVVKTRGLSIRGSNDNGFGSWFQDLDNRCAQGQCNADDLLLQQVPWVSQAGSGWINTGPGSSRFQVLNDDYDGFESDCKTTAWRNVPYNITPWLWYEQTGQEDFLKMLTWWNTCTSLPSKQKADLSTQLVMVSNLAPEQMEVYSAPSLLTGRGENSEIVGASTGYQQPWVLAIPSNPKTAGSVCGGCDRFILLAAQTTSTLGTQVWLLPMTGRIVPSLSEALQNTILATGSDAILNPVTSFFTSHVVGEDALTDSFSEKVLITVITSSGNATSIIFDPTTASFDSPSSCGGSACIWSVSLIPGNALTSAAIVCNSSIPSQLPSKLLSLPCIVVYTQASARGSSDLILTTSVLSTGANTLSSSILAHGVTADKSASLTLGWAGIGKDFVGIFLYATRSNGTLEEGENILQMNKNERLDALLKGTKSRLSSSSVDTILSMKARYSLLDYIIEGSKSSFQPLEATPSPLDDGTRAYLYGSSISVSVDWTLLIPTVTVTVQPSPSPNGPPPRLGIGALPRLSSLRFNNSLLILAMSTDGSCDAGIYVNNADMTRCGLPDPSFDSDPFYNVFQNVPFTISYDFGLIDDWSQMIQTAGINVNGRLGMCNKYIQHGKIETGLRPSATLFPWTVRYTNSTGVDYLPHVEVGVLAIHDASVSSMPPQLLLCGEPTTKKGLVFDMWRLPQPLQLSSLKR
jgi:hypothetical protein